MTEIPAYCVWSVMRRHTKKPISADAVKEMQKYLTDIIKDITRKVEAIQDNLNNKLPGRLKRKRINQELISEAYHNV